MKEIILIKNGELALKGLNRANFEAAMVKNLKASLESLGEIKFVRSQSTVFAIPQQDDFPMDEAMRRTGKVFGIAAYSRALSLNKDMDEILDNVCGYFADRLNEVSTFKVNAKRADKSFPYKSPEICAMVGERILENFPHLSVDVHNPEEVITIEIRDFAAYCHISQTQGAGGMPAGTAGRAAILISGGIDSPVAAWMMAKRGIELTAIHFASPPYTSERAEMKVKSLLSKVAEYSGKINLYIVPFTDIQDKIAKNCPEDYFTLIMRRMMMRISEKIARKAGCMALITGESVGQVASQTLPALATTDIVVNMPVLRPVIGMDKEEIVVISRKIDTFEISIQPYEDCCTVFTPKHPKTKPTVAQCEEAESALDVETLCEEAANAATREIIG